MSFAKLKYSECEQLNTILYILCIAYTIYIIYYRENWAKMAMKIGYELKVIFPTWLWISSYIKGLRANKGLIYSIFLQFCSNWTEESKRETVSYVGLPHSIFWPTTEGVCCTFAWKKTKTFIRPWTKQNNTT